VSRGDRLAAALAVSLALTLQGSASALQCVGDCGLDGSVTVDEIVVGVSIALGNASIEICHPFDRSRDNAVTVDEILAGVGAALNGCTPNQAPETADLPAYRTYPGQQVRVTIPGTDPDGDTVQFASASLPEGAALDENTGLLAWDPGAADVGVYAIGYSVTDNGIPPLSATGAFELRVAVQDPCVQIGCEPTSGCTETPLGIEVPCCAEPPAERMAEPFPECPDGARLVVGRNFEGFGPLFTCDVLPVTSLGQGGTRVAMHIAGRCVSTAGPVNIRVQLYTEQWVLVNRTMRINLLPADNGFAAQYNLVSAIDDSIFEPPLLEGIEAELYVAIQDVNGLTLERTQRVRLTLGRVDDLPEIGSPVNP
jgi:hypothetical protein